MKTQILPLEPAAANFDPGRSLAYALRRDANLQLLHAAYALFSLYTLFMVFQHVPWRDEAGPWLYFRDHPFFPDILYLTRHEGHPFLWFLCVRMAELTGWNYLASAVLNWVFCVIAVGLLFYRSSLPLIARLAFAFAPTLVLEQAFTARDYAIAILLCFAAAALYPTAREKPLRFSLVLALLAGTNIFASALFAGISLQFLLEQSCAFGTRAFSFRPLFGRCLFANAVLVVSALLVVLQLAPIHLPGDPLVYPVPHMRPALDHFHHKGLVLTSVALLGLACLSRGAGRPGLFGLGLFVLLALVPMSLVDTSARHLLMLSLGVVYFCWIYLDDFLAEANFLGFRINATGVQVLVSFFIFLAAWAATPLYSDLLLPKYDARNAARAIQTRGLDQPDTLVVATDPFRLMPLHLFLKNIRQEYVPPQFGASPQAFAQDAYVHYFLENCPVVADLKPLILQLAAKNPDKKIVVIATLPQDSSDPFAQDPTYRLDLIYRSPPWPHPSSAAELYSIYLLKTR